LRLDKCGRAPLLAWGMVIEPLIHPKPGAVSPVSPHPDKDVVDYGLHSSIAAAVLVESCRAAYNCRGFMARGFRLYLRLLERAGIRTNIALGSLLLHMPLSASLTRSPPGPEEMAREASAMFRECGGREDAREYYRVLERLGPSHLRRKYEGPLPPVGGGDPPSMLEVAAAVRWDHVHRELIEGYPLTLEAYKIIRREGLRRGALRAIIEALASHGDTLIAAKYGFAAHRRAVMEARLALAESRGDPARALERLDSLWRPRGWNPGAVLDIVATATSLYIYYDLISPGPD